MVPEAMPNDEPLFLDITMLETEYMDPIVYVDVSVCIYIYMCVCTVQKTKRPRFPPGGDNFKI